MCALLSLTLIFASLCLSLVLLLHRTILVPETVTIDITGLIECQCHNLWETDFFHPALIYMSPKNGSHALPQSNQLLAGANVSGSAFPWSGQVRSVNKKIGGNVHRQYITVHPFTPQ